MSADKSYSFMCDGFTRIESNSNANNLHTCKAINAVLHLVVKLDFSH